MSRLSRPVSLIHSRPLPGYPSPTPASEPCCSLLLLCCDLVPVWSPRSVIECFCFVYVIAIFVSPLTDRLDSVGCSPSISRVFDYHHLYSPAHHLHQFASIHPHPPHHHSQIPNDLLILIFWFALEILIRISSVLDSSPFPYSNSHQLLCLDPVPTS